VIGEIQSFFTSGFSIFGRFVTDLFSGLSNYY
jgi:hypothetical protein